MKIFTVADVPDALVQEWMQHLRNFDTANAGCHFAVIGLAPDMSLDEIMEALTVSPEFAVKYAIAQGRR